MSGESTETGYTCPTRCVEQNHPGHEHEAWVSEVRADLAALATTGAVGLDRWCTEQETWRPINRVGTCDNCAAGEVPLVYAIDVPPRGDSAASEPWLCQDCSDLGRFQTLLTLVAPDLLTNRPTSTGGQIDA